MLSDDLIGRAKRSDMDALVELDQRGFLIGRGESASDYAARLTHLCRRYGEMNKALAEAGEWELEGMRLNARDRIDQEFFAEASRVTLDLYKFAADWVSGFFVNPSFGWLFGGCAYYFYPDFFVLFIIRRSFAARDKWLIYRRTELLAHELCHAARVGLQSAVFEEGFAYRTATTRFRRTMGSAFRDPRDSYLLLGATFVLLIAQVLRIALAPGLWIWPFWGALFVAIGAIGGRHWHATRLVRRAEENLKRKAGECAAAVLFRCTDEEIARLAQLDSRAELDDWVDFRAGADLRWSVIRTRFMQTEPEEKAAEHAGDERQESPEAK